MVLLWCSSQKERGQHRDATLFRALRVIFWERRLALNAHVSLFYTCEVQKLVFSPKKQTTFKSTRRHHICTSTTNDDGKRIVVVVIVGGLFSNNRGRAGAKEVVVVVFSIRALLYAEEEL